MAWWRASPPSMTTLVPAQHLDHVDCDSSACRQVKYECDGTKCVENSTGTYATADCDKNCAAPPDAYACNGAACVGTAGGPYSTSVRSRLCQLSISIVLIVTAQRAARHHA